MTMEREVNKCFTFFYKKLKIKDNLTFKNLRKTYVTSESIYANSRISLQHSNYLTTTNHYINPIEIVKMMVKKEFKVFN